MYNEIKADERRRDIIGRFFITLSNAEKYIRTVTPIFRSEFVVMESNNGYLVVNVRQLSNGK